MSTGADPKTMPVTPEYAENHERIFGERQATEKVERRVFVSRCSKCEGVVHEPKTLLWTCPKCGAADSYGLVDAALAPALTVQHTGDGIASGRFYENTFATDGTDIGSRKRHREYMKEHGLTTASDYTEQWKRDGERRERILRGERGALPKGTRREVLEKHWYTKIQKP